MGENQAGQVVVAIGTFGSVKLEIRLADGDIRPEVRFRKENMNRRNFIRGMGGLVATSALPAFGIGVFARGWGWECRFDGEDRRNRQDEGHTGGGCFGFVLFVHLCFGSPLLGASRTNCKLK